MYISVGIQVYFCRNTSIFLYSFKSILVFLQKYTCIPTEIYLYSYRNIHVFLQKYSCISTENSANQWLWWYPNVILVLIISWQNFGSMITHDAKSDGGESVYIAKSAYKKMERVLTSRSVSMDTRLRLLTTGMLCLILCLCTF
jgi:hypothetical protein